MWGVGNKSAREMEHGFQGQAEFREEDGTEHSETGYQDFTKTCNNSNFMLSSLRSGVYL